MPNSDGLVPLPRVRRALTEPSLQPRARRTQKYLGTSEDRLWDRSEKNADAQALLNGPVTAVGFAPAETRQLQRLFKPLGLGAFAATPGVSELGGLACASVPLTYLLVNLDGFSDVDDAVGELLQFRQTRRDVVVVLVSGNLLRDDLGNERRPICDASLRTPLNLTQLKAGLLAATRNNQDMRALAKRTDPAAPRSFARGMR